MTPKILIVDDEVDICLLIQIYLLKEGYQVVFCHSGKEAIQLVKTENPDLIILDVLLPDATGLEICPTLRELTHVPIIFLSCKKQEYDKIAGLEAGGDDYISKPFSPRELVARIKANLRRESLKSQEDPVEENTIELPYLQINRNNHTICIRNETIHLSVKEFELLIFLAESPNKIFSAEEIYDHVWGNNNIGDIRTVMVHIRNLRKKIEQNPSRPHYIINVRGAGYMLVV